MVPIRASCISCYAKPRLYAFDFSPEMPPSMTTSDPSPQANVTEVEVIKSLEQRGLQGLDSLSLEELQLLTERKRKQIHLEATEKKAMLESEISSVEAKIQDLIVQKQTLAEELSAVLKSLGLEANGAQRPARPRKPKKSEDTQAPPSTES